MIFVGPLFIINQINTNPGFNGRKEYPRAFLVIQTVANVTFGLMMLDILICFGIMVYNWNRRPTRHKSFAVTTASFLFIFIMSKLLSLL